MIIDAHLHVWDLTRARYDWLGPQTPELNRTFAFDEARGILAESGIGAAVLVQAADNVEDTAYLLEVAAANPEVAGVVGYLPVDDPESATRALAELTSDPVVVGIRTLIHDRDDPDFLIRPEVIESLGLIGAAGLAYDVVAVLPRHLEHVSTLAERLPGLRLVIDHLAKPPVGAGDSIDSVRGRRWRELLTRAAEHPQVFAKVSGLYPGEQPTAWTTESIRPFVGHALDCFGPDRLLYGGDWPVSITAGGYARTWAGLSPILAELSESDRARVLAGTAAEVYRLDLTRVAALGVGRARPSPGSADAAAEDRLAAAVDP